MRDLIAPGVLGGHIIDNDCAVLAIGSDRPRRLPELDRDRQLFSLGLVYWSSGFDRDLVFQFENTAPLKTFKYDVQVLEVPGWENVLQSLPNELFQQFCVYLSSLSFTNAHNKVIYQVRSIKYELHGVPVVFFFCGSNTNWYVPYLVPGQNVVAPVERPPDRNLINVAHALFRTIQSE